MPETDVLRMIVQGGVGVAVIVVVWMFLRFLREERADRGVERERHLQTLDRLAETVDCVIAKCGGPARHSG